jgi:hypothetical protein
MSNNDKNQTVAAASTAAQPAPAATPKDMSTNPPVSDPSDLVKKPAPAQTTGGNK